jgi:hypothetical protein
MGGFYSGNKDTMKFFQTVVMGINSSVPKCPETIDSEALYSCVLSITGPSDP